MGIINNDSMDTDDGFSVTGAYVSVGSNRVSVQRTGLDESNVATYNIRFSATFWKDKAWRDAGSTSFKTVGYNTPITDLSVPLYTSAYNILKAEYTNNTDST